MPIYRVKTGASGFYIHGGFFSEGGKGDKSKGLCLLQISNLKLVLSMPALIATQNQKGGRCRSLDGGKPPL